MFFYIEYKANKMITNIRENSMKIWQRIYWKILAAFGIVVVWLQAGTCLFLPYHDAEPQNNTIFAGLFRYKNNIWYLCKTNMGKCPPLLSGHGGSSGMTRKT